MNRYITYRTIDGRDLFGAPVVDGLEILGVVEAECYYPDAVRLAAGAGVMPWGAASEAQRACALRLTRPGEVA